MLLVSNVVKLGMHLWNVHRNSRKFSAWSWSWSCSWSWLEVLDSKSSFQAAGLPLCTWRRPGQCRSWITTWSPRPSSATLARPQWITSPTKTLISSTVTKSGIIFSLFKQMQVKSELCHTGQRFLKIREVTKNIFGHTQKNLGWCWQ